MFRQLKFKKFYLLTTAIFLAVFILSGCTSSEEKYNEGYSDGRRDRIYPEDITREYVNGDPERYCGEYADEKVVAFNEYLKGNYNRYDK